MFGTACFALEGIGLILPVKAAMRDADQPRFFLLLNAAVALVASAYILFGVFGYLFWGPAVLAPVTGNLTAGIASDAVRVSLCISLFFSFVLQLFPVTDISDYATYVPHAQQPSRGTATSARCSWTRTSRRSSSRAQGTGATATATPTAKATGMRAAGPQSCSTFPPLLPTPSPPRLRCP